MTRSGPPRRGSPRVRLSSLGSPVDQRLTPVDRVRLRRQPAVRLVQNKARRDLERRLRPFNPRDEQPMGGRAGARMDGQERERPEPVLRCGEDRRQRLRAMDHDEPPVGLEDRETGANPGDERRGAGSAGKDMRARPRPVGRDANRPGIEERRIGDDRLGLPVGELRRSPGAGVADVEPEDPRALGQSVAFGIAGGKGCKIGVDLDEVGADAWQAAKNCKRDRADAGADIRESTVRKTGRRGEEGRVGSGPMTAPGLDEGEMSTEPGVAGQSIRP